MDSTPASAPRRPFTPENVPPANQHAVHTRQLLRPFTTGFTVAAGALLAVGLYDFLVWVVTAGR